MYITCGADREIQNIADIKYTSQNGQYLTQLILQDCRVDNKLKLALLAIENQQPFHL